MQINKNLSVPRWYLIGHFGMLSKSVQHRVLQLLPVRLVGWSTVLWGQDCGFGWFEFLCSMATDFTTRQSQPAVPKICSLAHKADWVRKYRWVNSNLSPQLGEKKNPKLEAHAQHYLHAQYTAITLHLVMILFAAISVHWENMILLSTPVVCSLYTVYILYVLRCLLLEYDYEW